MVKIVDKAIWSIGPVFIGIAVLLLDMCALAYYLVVFPYSHEWTTETSLLSKIWTVLILVFTLYVVYCIHFHYYMAIVTSPGGMEEYKIVPSSASNGGEVADVREKIELLHIQLEN